MKKVLIVDDDSDLRELLRADLEDFGQFEIFEAGDAKSVEAIVQEHALSLVFMDIHLPHLDGKRLFKEMFADKDEQIPVIAVSGSGHEEEFTEQGFAGFLLKPYDPKTLESLVKRLLP